LKKQIFSLPPVMPGSVSTTGVRWVVVVVVVDGVVTTGGRPGLEGVVLAGGGLVGGVLEGVVLDGGTLPKNSF